MVKFTVMGYWVTTKAECDTVLLVAMLKGERQAVEQCRAIRERLPD